MGARALRMSPRALPPGRITNASSRGLPVVVDEKTGSALGPCECDWVQVHACDAAGRDNDRELNTEERALVKAARAAGYTVCVSRKERFADWVDSGRTSRKLLVGFLTELQREIAGDGPHARPPGALEAFDAACDRLGVPFLEP